MGTILVDSGTWGDTRSFSDKLKIFEESVRDCAVLEIDYSSRTGESSHRKIEPHVLVFKQSVWYVYAFCRKQRAFRLFRLGRIRSAVLTGEKFIRRPFKKEDIPLTFWSNETSSVDVALEVSDEAFADVQDWLGGENLRQIDGKWRANVTLPDDSVLVRKILGLGSAVKVLAPEQLKERVKEEAKKIAALYS
jgi:predicted DNA-binding transcriptional regulator YafY